MPKVIVFREYSISTIPVTVTAIYRPAELRGGKNKMDLGEKDLQYTHYLPYTA